MPRRDQAETLQRVLSALNEAAGPSGSCHMAKALTAACRITDFSIEVVRSSIKALVSLGVLEIARQRREAEAFGRARGVERTIRIVRPNAVIVKRNGYLEVVDRKP